MIPRARATGRALGYQIFYRLPVPLRRRLVRLAVPKYVVGAVTLVKDAEATGAGRILLLRQPPGYSWTLPAGLLQRGEAPVVGAARELYEESGVRLSPDALRPAVPNAVVHAKGWVDVVFEAAFHPLDDLPRLSRATANLLGFYGIGPRAGERPPAA